MTAQAEKIVQFKIQRYNPNQERRYTSEFKVPVRKGMTLLDALLYIQDNLDGSLAFRHSCRMGVCGSCGILVNGKPMLACYTQVLHLETDKLILEPLQNLPVIKDLVVDIDPFFKTYEKIKPVLVKPQEAFKAPQEFTQTPNDLKKYWDLTLCTKCGICYSACPAVIDERFLGPSTYATNYRFIADSRDEDSDARLQTMSDNLWLCTSCNSCTQFCPKEVDCSASVIDERELMVENGDIPRTVKDVLTSVNRYHNPFGVHPNKRLDWAKGIEIQIYPQVTKAEILCFVGCASAYDLRGQAIAKALIQALDSLDVNYAILGNEEWCCGDHIMRLGEQGLFEMLAEHNVAMFEKFEAKKILTISPHCFNTLKNDEPYKTNKLPVQHYTQFLADALKNGKLKVSNLIQKKVAYHDPCFLGKRNEIFDPPRQILEALCEQPLIELKRTRENSFCCGGGAGRTWTEEAPPEKRPSVDRVQEALDLGVEILATACPFCVTTLEDAVKVLEAEEKIVVMDILELLAQAA
jgi:succinate dehydrogenase/fumarate reductase iron-sulfur protein